MDAPNHCCHLRKRTISLKIVGNRKTEALYFSFHLTQKIEREKRSHCKLAETPNFMNVSIHDLMDKTFCSKIQK